MALGGGTWTAQDKVLPGAYINFVNATTAVDTVGDRGVVAIPYALNKSAGTVIEIDVDDFINDAETILGFDNTDDEAKPFREIFKHARKCLIYDLGENRTAAQAVAAFEPLEFNTLAIYTNTAADVTTYITAVKNWRDNGKKVQGVAYNASAPDHEGIINVISTVSDTGADPHALVAWVAGAEAAAQVNESCTNMIYDGEYTVATTHTQAELATAMQSGQFVFHLVYGDVRVLEDINSLTTINSNTSGELKYNQTIRVIDEIGNGIAKMFVTKHLGKTPNDESGRVSIWADVIAMLRELEKVRAIEQVDSSQTTIVPGISKRAVVVNTAIRMIGSLDQLYMTVAIQ